MTEITFYSLCVVSLSLCLSLCLSLFLSVCLSSSLSPTHCSSHYKTVCILYLDELVNVFQRCSCDVAPSRTQPHDGGVDAGRLHGDGPAPAGWVLHARTVHVDAADVLPVHGTVHAVVSGRSCIHWVTSQ